MNWVDLIILGTVTVALFAGLLRGAVRTVFSVAGVIVGFLVASRESGAVGVVLSRWMRDDLAAVIGFVLVLLGIAVAFTLTGWLFRKLLQGLFLGWIDRLAGAALGFVQAAVVLGVLALISEGYGSFAAARSSVTYPYAVEAGRVLLEIIPEDTLDRLRWDELKERLRLPRLGEGDII